MTTTAARQPGPLQVAAARLQHAAKAVYPLLPDGPDAQKVGAMAVTPPDAWTAAHVEASASWMAQHCDLVVAAQIDPMMLRPEVIRDAHTAHQQHNGDPTVPQQTSAKPVGAPTVVKPSPVSPRSEPAEVAEFDYEHTIDGLRGISIGELSAVSDKAAERFTAAGLETVYDLLAHVPLRYIDRSQRVPIADLVPGEDGTTIAVVKSSRADTLRNGMKVARITIGDDTGTVDITFFRAAWQAKRFEPGDEVVAQGRVDVWTSQRGTRHLQMTNPLLDRTGDQHAPIVPIYPQSVKKAGLTTWAIHRAAMEAIDRMGTLTDPVPEQVLSAHGLMDRTQAFRQVHRPDKAGAEREARRRLAYDELLRMQMALGMKRRAAATDAGVQHAPTGALTGQFLQQFPWPPTGAQSRVIDEITADMTRPDPMHRLLQGDVGAGKTFVATMALLVAVEGGFQGALMAPTEILATQHFDEITRLVADLRSDGKPLVVRALTNKVRTKARRETLSGLKDGSVHLVVGTHALLSDDVEFCRLGLAVVDEQHRFGVEQRSALRDAAGDAVPDLLVMTATPIPRTAAMTVFGDLTVSALDEMPPGRTPIHTEWVDEAARYDDPDQPMWAEVRSQVAEGRQAYVVCPLVEESETRAAASATEVRDALEAGALSGHRIGLVHGKQKPDERAEVMAAFRDGGLDVLAATTVIEVGVNVPNATVITILDAPSFGMAQLHQLRGRVGRGKHASRCFLVGEINSVDGQRRLAAMVESTDGFRLSEVDLDIRGPGSILGSRQSGLSDLRVASLKDDAALLAAAREDADHVLDADPTLGRRPTLCTEILSVLGEAEQEWLGRS